MSIQADKIESVKLSLQDGMEFVGNDTSFKAFIDTDEINVKNERNLFSISGKVNGCTYISENKNIVKATNENGIYDSKISNYIATEVNTIENSGVKYNVDSSMFGNSGTAEPIPGGGSTSGGGSTGGGGAVPAPAPTTDDSQKTEEQKPSTSTTTTTATETQKPATVKVSKTKAKKNGVVVTWKTAKDVTGYEIQLATDKKFKKNKKTVTVAKQNASKKTVKKLKEKKKYYVRVRSYKIVNGKKAYGKWSKIKSVKTK